jgi:hypothetical protein
MASQTTTATSTSAINTHAQIGMTPPFLVFGMTARVSRGTTAPGVEGFRV